MRTVLMLAILFHCIPSGAQTRKLEAEPNHSTIGFKIDIAGFSKVAGKFTDYQINLDWNEKDVDSCTVSAIIQVSSINTGIPKRDEHLRTADFFDADNHPSIVFESDSIKKINYSNYEAHGKLTMHGISRNFTLPLHIVKIEDNTAGFSSRTTLNRIHYKIGSDFKHTSMPDFLSEEVELEFYFWTRKRKE